MPLPWSTPPAWFVSRRNRRCSAADRSRCRPMFVRQSIVRPSTSEIPTTPSSQPPAGLTLVEMLVGMAITLVMMAAVVTLFANVSSSVRNRRANAELGAQLRHTRSRLAQDLAGATAPGRTWLRPEAAVGYLEIIDGPWSDSNPSPLIANNELDYATSLVPSAGVRDSATNEIVTTNGASTDGGGLGDFDGILALTVKSQGDPFRGRVFNVSTNRHETIESEYAEVIWYAIENPADGSLGEPGMRTLYRRVLLIAPWLELPELTSLPGGNIDEQILYFYQNFDISAQIYQVQVDGTLVPNMSSRLVANTLADLTKRENRFAHRLNIDQTSLAWPFIMDQRAIRFFGDGTLANLSSPLQPFGWPPSSGPVDRLGEDVMLNDVLAFDLRVYDPGAPQIVRNAGPPNGDVLEPSDPGWNVFSQNEIVGFGAYVNLGWDPGSALSMDPSGTGTLDPAASNSYTGPFANYVTKYTYNYGDSAQPTEVPLNGPKPLFKDPRQPGWHPLRPTGLVFGYPAVYDTWSFHYEHDGLDQDNDGIIDEGANGLDDPITPGDPLSAVNGVDDIGEYETSPPYDTPLRGLKVILRAYERDARQIRETSVTHTFVP